MDMRRGIDPRTSDIAEPLSRDVRYLRIAEALRAQAAAAARTTDQRAFSNTDARSDSAGNARSYVKAKSSATSGECLHEVRLEEPESCVRILSVHVVEGECVQTGAIVARGVRLATQQQSRYVGSANVGYGSLYSVVESGSGSEAVHHNR